MYAGVLSDPKTLVVNFIGSGMHQGFELGSKVIAYPIGAAKAVGAKLFGFEGPKDRVKLGQLAARSVGTVHGLVKGFVSLGRGFLKGDMLDDLKQGDYEIDRLARTSGFAPLSIVRREDTKGRSRLNPARYLGLTEQTKEAFGDVADKFSRAREFFYDSKKRAKAGDALGAEQSLVTAGANVGRGIIKGIDIGFGALVSVPMRGLIGGDAMMKQIAKTAHLYEEAYVQASKKFNPDGKLINFQTAKQVKEIREFMNDYITNPNAEAYDRALNKAAIDTFTNTNIFADKIQDLIGRPGSLVHFATRPYIPFVQTVTNLYDRALFYSPFAPFMKRFREDVVKMDSDADTAVARLLLGSGLLSFGYMGANKMLEDFDGEFKDREARISGSGVTVDYAFLNTRKAAGWHEYAMYLTNPDTGERKAYTYNRLDPFAMQIAIGADIHDIVTMIQHAKNEREYYDNVDVLSAAVSGMTLSLFKNVIERNPLLQGMEAFGSAFLDTQRGLEGTDTDVGQRALRAVSEPILSIFTNAVGRRIDKTGFLGWDQIEDENYTGYLRDTYNLMDQVKYMAHTHAAVFGFGEWSKEKLNIDEIPYRFNIMSGEFVIDEVAQSDSFWRQVTAITQEHTIRDDKIAQELASLNFSKRRIKPEIALDGMRIPLSQNGDYLFYQKTLSDTFREKVFFAMRTPTYRNAKRRGDVLFLRETIDKQWAEALKTSKEIMGHIIINRHNSGVPAEADAYLKAKDREFYDLMRQQQNLRRDPTGGFDN